MILDFISPFTLGLFICLLTWYLWQRKPKHSPPGKRGIPFIGVPFSLIGPFPERILAKWTKKYGPVYSIKVGLLDVVVIGSPEAAYEAFAKNTCFNDRPQSIPMFTGGYGILFIDKSDYQKEQRRFGLHTLRQFGMGRRSLEPKLIEISNEMCGEIDVLCEKNGTSMPLAIHDYVYDSISSVISWIVFGHSVNRDDQEFAYLIEKLHKGASEHAYLNAIMMFAPFVKHLPVFSAEWKSSITFKEELHRGIEKEVTKHKETFDLQHPRDYIDCFLIEMINKTKGTQSSKQQTNENLQPEDDEDDCDYSRDWIPYSSFETEQLIAAVRDLFVAGTDTTASSVLWIFLYLCKYPEVQRRMQREIDDVLGHSGIPKMAMSEKLPYVQAVIQEVLRLKPIAPLSVPHKASKTSSLMGYQIPKGAIILTNIWGIQNDPDRWPEPEKFSPERHIGADGSFVKSSDWMIFNVGGRSCLGVQLAKMELFISVVTLFRRFYFTFEPGFEPNMDGTSSVALRPDHFKVIASRR